MSELDFEPVRGLPEQLPEGERILWQGEPNGRALARRVFHARKVAIYFGLLVVLRFGFAVQEGLSSALAGAVFILLLGILCVGLLAFMARLHVRTTVYTLTNRRVVMRYGIAFPMTVNVPFKQVRNAAMKLYPDGTAEIALEPTKPPPFGVLYLWPHAKPWQLSRPQPMLRCLPNGAQVAEKLSGALKAFSEQNAEGAPAAERPLTEGEAQTSVPLTVQQEATA
ncbi:MAG: photosynthetic complex putative assembly protein PuhB [Myxococcota bacterium]